MTEHVSDGDPILARPSAPQLDAVLHRTLDVVASLLLLIVLLVPMLAIAAAVRLGSSGPALFRQQRVGRDGRLFTFLKFRTMRPGSDDRQLRELIAREIRGEDTAEDGSTKLNNDTRITGLGRVLRRTSIDELPQLLNVLRGDMAMVGPRPCLEWEAQMFPAQFSSRFSVRPGITGLWQVSGRSEVGTLEMLRLDVAYVERRSVWTDIAILLRTVPALLRGSGAR